MASTFVNNLRLTELGTGDASGTWGNTTNTNLELIGQALGFGTRAIANASTDNITIADGASDSDRSMYLKLTGGGQACTVTLLPNTVSKLWILENNTNSTLTFTQGSGANVAILAGQTKAIATDGGAGSAIVYEVFTDLNLSGVTYVDDLEVGDDLIVTDDITCGGSIDLEGDIDVNGTMEADAITLNGTAIGSIYSPIASPTFTGTPLAPTAGANVNNTQLATTAYVTTAIGNADAFPQGTSMLFQQTSAPTGWTKQTAHNDKGLRLTTGTVGTGGSVAFTTAMATPAVSVGGVTGNPASNLAVAVGNLAVSMSGSISNTTLSINQIPSHSHQTKQANTGGNTLYYGNTTTGGGNNINNTAVTGTANAGGGGAHNHAHNISGSMSGAPSLSGNVTSGNLAVASSTATINLQYVDFIIANKD